MAAKEFHIPAFAFSITERLNNKEIVKAKEFFQLSLKAGSTVEWPRCGYMPGKARKRDCELIAIPRKLFLTLWQNCTGIQINLIARWHVLCMGAPNAGLFTIAKPMHSSVRARMKEGIPIDNRRTH